MGINCVCIAIVISLFTEFCSGGEDSFSRLTSHHRSSARSRSNRRHQNAVLGIQDRPIAATSETIFHPESFSGIKDHFGARKAVGRSIVRPRFNSCPPCSVTFRQLHCQVRARVRAWVRHPLAVGNLINNRNCLTV